MVLLVADLARDWTVSSFKGIQSLARLLRFFYYVSLNFVCLEKDKFCRDPFFDTVHSSDPAWKPLKSKG